MLNPAGAAWAGRVCGISATERATLSVLAGFSDSYGVCLGMSKPLLAHAVGLSVAGVSNILARLRERSLVACEGLYIPSLRGCTSRRQVSLAEQGFTEARSLTRVKERLGVKRDPGNRQMAALVRERLGCHLVATPSGDLLDAMATDEGLRQAADTCLASGFSGRAASAASLAFAHVAATKVSSLRYKPGVSRLVLDPNTDSATDEMASLAWQVFAERTGEVASARSPWGFILCAIQSHYSAENKVAQRFGVETFEDVAQANAPTPRLEGVERARLGYDDIATRPGVVGLVGALTRAGMPAWAAWCGTLRAVQIANSTRNSYELTRANSDEVFASLGISSRAGREWVRLILGPRDHMDQCLLADGADSRHIPVDSLLRGRTPHPTLG